MLAVVAVGILVVAIVFTLAPVIGGQIESGMPALDATSNWNSTYNTGLKTGADVWEQLSPFVIIVGLVLLAAIIIAVLSASGRI